MKKKLFNALCTLLICLLAFVALIALVGKIQNRVNFLFGRAAIWVLTGSMEDTIPAHSYILIEQITDPASQIREGDVITFYSSEEEIKGMLNTHRVERIDRENACFITKGDSSLTADRAAVPYRDVVGRYVRGLSVMTLIGRFLMNGWGFAITMLVLLALICAVYLPDIIRAFRDKKPQQSEHEAEIERRIAEEVERLKTLDQAHKDP